MLLGSALVELPAKKALLLCLRNRPEAHTFFKLMPPLLVTAEVLEWRALVLMLVLGVALSAKMT
jgi:hypothetical protein